MMLRTRPERRGGAGKGRLEEQLREKRKTKDDLGCAAAVDAAWSWAWRHVNHTIISAGAAAALATAGASFKATVSCSASVCTAEKINPVSARAAFVQMRAQATSEHGRTERRVSHCIFLESLDDGREPRAAGCGCLELRESLLARHSGCVLAECGIAQFGRWRERLSTRVPGHAAQPSSPAARQAQRRDTAACAVHLVKSFGASEQASGALNLWMSPVRPLLTTSHRSVCSGVVAASVNSESKLFPLLHRCLTKQLQTTFQRERPPARRVPHDPMLSDILSVALCHPHCHSVVCLP